MKKTFLMLLIAASPSIVFAQFQVNSNGKASIGSQPPVQDYYNIKYIQNETIQQDKLILANQVVISSNADPTAVQGSNSIISGKTSIISRSVSILKDFSVDSGAELYIGPQ